MPLFIPKTLLQAAQGGAQTKRYRDFAIAYFEGEGAIAVPTAIWQPTAAWANARQPSGNRMRDRGLLLQRLDVLVTRRGTTVCSTTGGMIPLARLRNAMRGEGVDLKEWNFPPDDVLDKALDPDSGKEGKAELEAGEWSRVDAATARSSAGAELRLAEPLSAEYRHGAVRCVIRATTPVAGGPAQFAVTPEAVAAGMSLDAAQKQILMASVRAGLGCLGLSTT